MVTVQERGCRAYRVSGNKKGPPTFLSAVDSDGVHQAFLEVSVKSLSSYRIAFYSVSDSNVATGKIIHTTHKRRSEDLKQLVQGVNEILRPQANVIFEMIEHLVIDAKGRPQMTPIQSVTIAKDLGPAVKSDIFEHLPSFEHPAMAFHVFVVWSFQGKVNGDAAYAGTMGRFCVFEDGIPYRQEAQVLAHEAMHYLLFSFGRSADHHHTKRLGDLMYPRGGAFGFERGTRLGRTYANVINP